MDRQYFDINPDDVVVGRRLRDDNGDLGSLVDSVRKLGVLAPIIVDRDNVLIAGARRLEACRQAGLQEIPAVKLDVAHDGMTAIDIQTDTNLCRLPLTPGELEAHIGAKKAILSGRAPQPSGVLGRVKRILSRE